MQTTSIPTEGFMRLPAVLAVIPISRSSWWSWVKDGKAPAPVKLGPRTTVWKAGDIRAFVESFTADATA